MKQTNSIRDENIQGVDQMKKLDKLASVFMAVAVLATGPGGPLALAQTISSGGNKYTPHRGGNRGGGHGGSGTARGTLETTRGAGVQAALANGALGGRPVVSQSERASAERVAVSAIAPETIVRFPGSSEIGPAESVVPTAPEQDIPSMLDHGSPYNKLIQGGERVGINSEGNEHADAGVERGVHQAKVTFDGASAALRPYQAPGVSIEGKETMVKPGLVPYIGKAVTAADVVPVSSFLERKRELFVSLSPYFDLGGGESSWSGVAGMEAAFLDAGDFTGANGYFHGNFRYMLAGQSLTTEILYSIPWVRRSSWFKTRVPIGRLTALMGELSVMPESRAVRELKGKLSALRRSAREQLRTQEALDAFLALVERLHIAGDISPRYARYMLGEAKEVLAWIEDRQAKDRLERTVDQRREAYSDQVPRFEDLLKAAPSGQM